MIIGIWVGLEKQNCVRQMSQMIKQKNTKALEKLESNFSQGVDFWLLIFVVIFAKKNSDVDFSSLGFFCCKQLEFSEKISFLIQFIWWNSRLQNYFANKM